MYSWGLLEEEVCNERSDGGVYSCTFFLEEERGCDEVDGELTWPCLGGVVCGDWVSAVLI